MKGDMVWNFAASPLQWTEDDPTEMFPVDEWSCADCGNPVGWVLMENDHTQRPVVGFLIFASRRNSPEKRFCEDCGMHREGK